MKNIFYSTLLVFILVSFNSCYSLKTNNGKSFTNYLQHNTTHRNLLKSEKLDTYSNPITQNDVIDNTKTEFREKVDRRKLEYREDQNIGKYSINHDILIDSCDKIILINNETINCIILEINDMNVMYVECKTNSETKIQVLKTNVHKIEFLNGTSEIFNPINFSQDIENEQFDKSKKSSFLSKLAIWFITSIFTLSLALIETLLD